MDDEQQECPERPELLKGQPIGMYHCPTCGCMVIAGLPHGPHDDGCWLGLDNPADWKPPGEEDG